jgi:hypothetical protein
MVHAFSDEQRKYAVRLLAADVGKLERELNAANERIKRLEEALEGTVKWIVDLADSGDAGFWDVDEQPEIIAARDALKKECK